MRFDAKLGGRAAPAIMGATFSDLYASVGIHSGVACGAASGVPSAFVAMRQGGGSKAIADGKPFAPTIVFHGDRDTTVHPNNADRITEQSATAPSTTTRVLRGHAPHGHTYTHSGLTRPGRGRAISEHWYIHVAGHAWSGGSPAGSYTDARVPGRNKGNAAFLPRAFARRLVGIHGALTDHTTIRQVIVSPFIVLARDGPPGRAFRSPKYSRLAGRMFFYAADNGQRKDSCGFRGYRKSNGWRFGR